MKDKIIVALDFSSKQEALAFLEPVKTDLEWVKIGMELFYKEGPTIVEEIKNLGFKIFLDLKLHDIPNTVEKATESLLNLPIDMLNFHIAGGSEMLKRVAAIKPDHMQFIGVTQLTSTDAETLSKELLITKGMDEAVLSYAAMAKESGLDGVVCSAQDLTNIKTKIPGFVCVCPGIRLASDQKQDQKRVMTPAAAVKAGADYLVIGRSITKAKNPIEAIRQIQEEIKNV